MKYHLIPYDNLTGSENKNFKFIRKMALVPYQNDKINSSANSNTRTSASDFYQNYKDNKALEKTLNQPANVTVLSNLSREIVDILNDNNLNEDQRVSNYIHAIKRYLIFRDKVFNLTPVVSHSKPIMKDKSQQIKPKMKDDSQQFKTDTDDKYQQYEKQGTQITDNEEEELWGDTLDIPDTTQNEDEILEAEKEANEKLETEKEDSFPFYNIDIDDFYLNDKRFIKNDEIIKQLHHTQRLKGKKLLRDIKNKSSDSEIGWNKKKEIIVNDVVIPGSNIIKLIGNATKSNKAKSKSIKGFKEFSNILNRLKIKEKETKPDQIDASISEIMDWEQN